ncbi:MAG: prepilin-type N-terminal cleavage/methylation domain-containing protein [Patescibacteria group bacterium]|nr:MAG: prepilin-type N-terminal cleavage/methylation domain-containing protein [Patescibacteria group bacterium]
MLYKENKKNQENKKTPQRFEVFNSGVSNKLNTILNRNLNTRLHSNKSFIKQYNKTAKAFTLIELLVVIAIIGILSTLVIVALGNSRTSARDAKRLNDLKAMANALELYYADNNAYPEADNFSPGDTFEAGGVVYMNKVPNNPTPRTDGDCPDQEYRYVKTNNSYSIIGCVGSSSLNISAGGVILETGGSLKSVGVISGMVGWWRFNEGNGNTVLDWSGNNHHGTWTGTGPYYTTNSVEGGFGGSFNGSNNLVTIPNHNDLNFGTSSFTITVWASDHNPSGNNTWANVINKGNPRLGYNPTYTGTGAYGIGRYTNVQNQYHFTIGDGAINNQRASSDLSDVGEPYYFLALSINRALGEMRAYVNGVQVGAVVTITAGSVSNSAPLYFGNGNGYWNGKIDDVRLYNKALSAEDIQTLYSIITQ